jgi:nitrogen regulatory protein P-II 1
LKALFMVLNKTEKLDEVLKAFLDCGVKGATILNSTGMGRRLAKEVPIFASLGIVLDGGRDYSYTLFAVMNEDKVKPVVETLDKVLGNLDDPDTAVIFTLPVDGIYGLSRLSQDDSCS